MPVQQETHSIVIELDDSPVQGDQATRNTATEPGAGRKRQRTTATTTPGAGTSSGAVVVDLTALPDTPSDDDEVQIVGVVRRPRQRQRSQQDDVVQIAQPPQPAAPPAPPSIQDAWQAAQAARLNMAAQWPATLPPPPASPPHEKGFKCSICMERVEDTTSTSCGHVFCTACITQSVKLYKKCPKCNKNQRLNQLHKIYLDT